MLKKVFFVYVLGILFVHFYIGEGPFAAEGMRYEPETVPAYTDSLRQSCRRVLRESGLSESSVALSMGILLGDKSQIPAQDKAEIRQSGMSHLMSVSGLHIGILWMLLLFLFHPLSWMDCTRKFGIRGHFWFRPVLLLSLWVYIILIGAPISAVRAGIMLTMVEISWFARVETWGFHNLYSAGLLILLFSPMQLYQPGFQLSFLATAGILAFRPWLEDGPKLQQLVMVSLAAQVFTFPVVAYWFHQVPVLGWVQGIFVLPFVAVYVYLLLFLFVCTWLLPFLVSFVAFCIELCTHWMLAVAHYLSQAELWLLGGRLEWRPNLLETLLMEAAMILIVWLLRHTLSEEEEKEKRTWRRRDPRAKTRGE